MAIRRAEIRRGTTTIYGLDEPRHGLLRYVGRTMLRLRKRMDQHWANMFPWCNLFMCCDRGAKNEIGHLAIDPDNHYQTFLGVVETVGSTAGATNDHVVWMGISTGRAP